MMELLALCSGVMLVALLLLMDIVVSQAREIRRLRRGDFTPEELQGLCHNLSEENEAAFKKGCEDYQKKLFGPKCKGPLQ